MKIDWCSCDGTGFERAQRKANEYPTANTQELQPVNENPRIAGTPMLSRRQLLWGSALSATSFAAAGRSALANVSVRPGGHKAAQSTSPNVLVTIFLRGGADGLNIVVPYGEDAYYRNRQTIGIAAPNDKRQTQRALKLDEFFGLHPALSALQPLYGNGSLTFVHACGSGDQTRSHFEAMSTMESGAKDERSDSASGWLARHLASTQARTNSPLRAVAFSSVMPDVLRGATDATALNSLDDFHLHRPRSSPSSTSMGEQHEEGMHQALMQMYADGHDEITQAGRETLSVLKTLNRLAPQQYQPAGGAAYPETDLGNGLRQVACLIKADVGLEVACLDRGGWDTHIAQGGTDGWMAQQLNDMGQSLAAFTRDMDKQMRHVTVVVMTEFGRRLQENSGLGTDHGRAGVMMLLGGGVRGGQVFTRWPGLEDDQLEAPGDLRSTTDYRDVLAEVLAKRLHNNRLEGVFLKHYPRFCRLLNA
ncbi:MAG TPA: DUF1501 domain-containing protein [Abditibacteriaceae bacterium]|jgi:uncharacterized protein (DUF1501 family)